MGVLAESSIDTSLINIVRDYFRGRCLKVGEDSMTMTQGVPQGSVLGPLLWNFLYDGIIRLKLQEGCTTTAYADDLALVTIADSKEDLIHKTNEAISVIVFWIKEHGLNVAPEKAEGIILKGPRKRVGISFTIEGRNITPTKYVKYLGVWLDEKTIFSEHIRKTCENVKRQCASLSRLLSNVQGPGYWKRKLLYGVVSSVLLYAAPIWGKVINVQK